MCVHARIHTHTGRADPAMLDHVRVKAYEADVALSHVAQVRRVTSLRHV